jgi:AraC-like DNA-binding protein
MKALYEDRSYETDFRLSCGLAQNLRFHAHYHRESEWVSLTKGAALVGVNAEIYRVEAGESLFIRGGDIHYYASAEGAPENETVLLIFDSGLLKTPEKLEPPSLFAGGDAQAASLISEIFQEMQAKEECDKSRAASLAGLLQSGLLRRADALRPVAPFQGRSIRLEDFQNVLAYMDENPNCALEEAAACIHYSPWYFSKLFKKLTGETFSFYKNARKIERAKDALLQDGASVIDVAAACGFENLRTFNREFKKRCGASPSQFRRGAFPPSCEG